MSIWQPGDTLSSFFTRNAANIRAALGISPAGLDAETAALVEDSGSDLSAALGAQFAPLAATGAKALAAAQSIPNNAWTTIALASEWFDTDTLHDNATDNERIYVPTTGLYLIVASLRWTGNATNVRGVRVIRNGSTGAVLGSSQHPAASTGVTVSHVTIAVPLTAGDFVSMQGYQLSGAALNTDAAVIADASLSLVLLGA